MCNVLKRLIEVKEGLYELPIGKIPRFIGDIFYDYEEYVFSKDYSENEVNLHTKLESFRDELEADYNLSIRDIENKLSDIITQASDPITGNKKLNENIIKSIVDLFNNNEYYIKLNLIPHLVKNFKIILDDEQLIKILYRLETMGYEIGFISYDEGYGRLSFDKSVLDIDDGTILDIIYEGDLIIYNLN